MLERSHDQLRPVTITPDFTDAPLASVLISTGNTRVLCTASREDRVPRFRLDSGGGWLTAEYSMLPGSTPDRKTREISRGKRDGRSTEIQRLIGRSLRAGFDLDVMGEFSLWIDCDVLQADGGTRTASITGGYVAARLAIERMIASGLSHRSALKEHVGAISVGIVGGSPWLDLDYGLDSCAEVDLNVVMIGDAFVEVQGTAEGAPFSRQQLDELLDLARKGIGELVEVQQAAIAEGLKARPRA